MLKKKEICLSPRSGVAFRVDGILDERVSLVDRTGGQMVTETKEYNHKCVCESGQAFCLLPLHAVHTGLPVHINGHFVLDPARQYLRNEDSDESPQGLWNKLLTENIIPTGYVKAIEFLRDYLFKTDLPHNAFMTERRLTERGKCYLAAFPSFQKATTPVWRNLVTCVYSTLVQNEVEIFPVTVDNSIKWVAITSQGHRFPAFFDDLSSLFEADLCSGSDPVYQLQNQSQRAESIKIALIEAHCLSGTLKSIGLKLIDFPIYFFDNIIASLENVHKTLCGIENGKKYIETVRKVSAKDILEFLLTDKTDLPDCCDIKNLGENIKITNFKSIKTVQILLKFCILHEKDFLSTNLKKLPLLVKNDDKLDRFENSSLLYLSSYCDLLHASKELFVHRELFSILQSVHLESKDVLRSMEISDFVELLPRSMDARRLRSDTFLFWDNGDVSFPTEQWIILLWEYLNSLSETDPSVIINKLNDWCLVPGTDQINNYNILVPLKLSYIVIDCVSFEQTDEIETFGSLRLPKPFEGCSEITKLNMVIASSKRPDSILQCLFFHRKRLQSKICTDEKGNILRYLNRNFDKLSKLQYLFPLPFYETVTGQRTAIDQRMKVRIVKQSKNLVKEGLNEWANKSGYIILYNVEGLENLLSFVGKKFVTITDFYQNDLLPNFKMLHQSCHLRHLQYIREKVKFQELDFANTLKGIEFIPNQNKLESARHFFYPNIELFKSMHTVARFPPSPFDEDIWNACMICAGMQDKVSVQIFIDFAKDLEKRLLRYGLGEDLRRQSKKMVAHIFEREGVFQENLLQKIQYIRFLLPHIIEDCDRSICPQNSVDDPICFSGSAIYNVRRLVWTTMSILPKYADPFLALPRNESEKVKTFHEMLNISFNPQMKTVVSHVHNVCNVLRKIFHEHNLNPQHNRPYVGDIREFMKDIYSYLLKHGLSDKTKRCLSETPFMHIKTKNDMHFFIKPDQATMDLQPEDEIWPYLFKMPMEYGNFCELFAFHGTKEKVAIYHYANVLKCLHKEQTRTDGLLAPDEKKKAKKAYDGFLKILNESEEDKIRDDLKSLKDMYLLSDSKNMQTLVKSTELIIADDRNLKNRLSDTNICFLVAKKNIDAFRKVPEILRPRFLTDVVEIILISSQDDTVNGNRMSETLKHFLQSNNFLRGVDMFVTKNVTRSTNAKNLEKMSTVLAGLQVRCLNRILTVLKIKGEEITETQQEADYFLSKQKKVIFLKRNEWTISEFRKRIKESLCTELCQLTLNKIEQLQMEKLFEYIDDLDGLKEFVNKLTDENDDDADDDEWCPTLGNYVPKQLHILLDNNFSELSEGDYVAYELWDPDIDEEDGGEDTIFIYVQVLRKLSSASDILRQQYLIDMGSNTEEKVPAIQLYRFIRKLENPGTDVVIFTDCHQGTTTFNPDRIFDQILRTLVDAWEHDKQVRKRIVKRLLLRWHPDKNEDNEDFCKKVTQFILEQIERLENHITTTVTEWSFFADILSTRYSKYHHSYQSNWSSWLYESPKKKPNPQPEEARRWIKQAKLDLTIAKSTIFLANEAKAYNWVCVQCQQACEKACKAVGINIDSDRVNQYTHRLAEINNWIDIQFSERLTNALRQMENLTGSYTRMRYPLPTNFPRIPSELYTEEKATEAVQIASEIIDELANMLQHT